jgi:hypothetical protein
LATSNEKPGFARLFHLWLNTDLLVSTPVLKYEQTCLTDIWNPPGQFSANNQITEHKGCDRRV